MTLSNRAVGNKAEELACSHLQEAGYKILTKNFTIQGGELDVVAQKDGCIIAVEVKARFTHEYGTPEESITLRKLRLLKRTLEFYTHRYKLEKWPCRIDMVAIDYIYTSEPRVSIIENISY